MKVRREGWILNIEWPGLGFDDIVKLCMWVRGAGRFSRVTR